MSEFVCYDDEERVMIHYYNEFGGKYDLYSKRTNS